MRTNVHHRKFCLVLVLCFIFLASSTVAPQTIKGYWPHKLDVGKLLNMLKSDKNIVYVPKYFFGKVYHDELPDLVFFIDRSQNADRGTKKSETEENYQINITLVKKNKKRFHLFGEPFIYVMVFVAESESDKQSVTKPICKYTPLERMTKGKIVKEKTIKTDIETKEAIKKSPPLKVKLSSLEWRPASGGFFLYSIAKGIASAVGGLITESKEPAEKPGEKPLPLEMHEVGRHNGTRLTYCIVKFRLAENSINRITIEGFSDIEGSSDIFPLATFGNYSSSRITSSIGMMWTHLDSRTATKEDISQNQVDPFVFAHFYLKRPQLPPLELPGEPVSVFFKKVSVSLVFGTKLEEDILNNIFIGACFGNFLFENFGIVIGKNLRLPKPNNSDDGKKRKGYWAVGFTYIF